MQAETKDLTGGQIHSKSLFSRIMMAPEMGVFIPLVILFVLTSVLNPNFLSKMNLLTMVKLMAFIAILTIGQSFVIVVGEIDLSVGQLAGLGTMVFAYAIIVLHCGLVPAVLLTLVVGVIMGFINGYCVSHLKLSNFIATLGMMYTAKGLKYLLTKGYPLYPLPKYLEEFGKATPLGLSWALFIAVFLYIGFSFVLKKTVFGRRLYATGDNKEVAMLSGIKVKSMKIWAYMICGALTALTGILLAIEANSGQPGTGEGWEFKTIASAAVGGVSLSGGQGSLLGAALGVIIVKMLDNCLIMLGVNSSLQITMTGVILVGAVLLDTVKRSRKIRS